MKVSKLKRNYFPEVLALLIKRNKPSMVSVNLTDACNQRCIYCEIGQNTTLNHDLKLNKDDLFWIIDQMASYNIKRLSMCGGEPFLFDGLPEVVEYAWSKGIRSNLTSNGMTIHSLDAKDLELLKVCKASVNISVDSFQDDIQTKTRGRKQALSNALKSIKTLQELGIPVTVLSAISKYNYHDLFNSFKTAYELGIQQILYQPIIYFSNYGDEKAIGDKALLNVCEEHIEVLNKELKLIYDFEKKHKISTNVYRILPWINAYITAATSPDDKFFYNDILNKFYCREAYAVIDISYNGGIQACGLSGTLINIKENKNKDLIDLWTEASRSLKQDLENDIFPEICNACCHKFSRNMFASALRYPVSNNKALRQLTGLIASRVYHETFKNTFIK
jgi:MoaA/NifB/PqqE/SkfB family radical SAM enzyme